jgi:hypothetical protein
MGNERVLYNAARGQMRKIQRLEVGQPCCRPADGSAREQACASRATGRTSSDGVLLVYAQQNVNWEPSRNLGFTAVVC